MNVQEFQKFCASVVSKIDDKYKIKRDFHFSFVQLSEEIGELARVINMPKLRGKEIDQDNLKEEFADVMLQLSILAEMHNVDLEKAVDSKVKIFKERHKLNCK